VSLLEDINTPDDIVKDPDYYEVLESHLSFMKTHRSTKTISIGLDQAAIYKGDFYGLLNSLHVDKKYHYPIMRVNGLLSSSDYDGILSEIIQPSEEVINDITTIYLSVEVK